MAHRCAGGLKKNWDLWSDSQRHRHFRGFFNMPIQVPTLGQPFYNYSEKLPHFSHLSRCTWGNGGPILVFNAQGPHGGWAISINRDL